MTQKAKTKVDDAKGKRQKQRTMTQKAKAKVDGAKGKNKGR